MRNRTITKVITSILFVLGLLLTILNPSFSKEMADHVKTFGNWSVYKKGKLCFALSDTYFGAERVSLYRQMVRTNLKDIFFLVTSDNVKFSLNSDFSMQVGGTKYQFYSTIEDDVAWNIEENTNSLDRAFAKGSYANFYAKNKDNKSFDIRFSLNGYTKAANFMESYCDAKPLFTNAGSSKGTNAFPSMSDLVLCSLATKGATGKKRWETSSYYQNHVKEAKRRGLNCLQSNSNVASRGADSSSKTTSNSFASMNNLVLCSLATKGATGKKRWETSPSYKGHVKEAKRRGLTCNVGVQTTVKKGQNCSSNPELCTVVQLCNKATKLENGKKVWRSDNSSQSFIRVAKDNGLSCKVDKKIVENESQKMVPASSGSGFFVSSNGHIITNEHVIEKCRQVFLHKKGEEPLETIVLARDVVNDLALLKANVRPKIIFPISDDNPYLTQDVTAAGYPMISTLGAEVKVTKGIVSALSAPDDFSRIQVDAAVQPGNSGGPIFDEFGNVLGVVVSGFSDMQNVNFGIKASVVKNLLVANMVNTMKPRKSSVNWRSFSSEVGEGTVLLSCWMTKSELAHLRKNNDKNRLLFDN